MNNKNDNFAIASWNVVVDSFQAFSKHDCLRMAAALSYYTIFSMPAVMVIVISIAGFFFDAEDVQGKVAREIRTVVGNSGAEQVRTMISHANRSGRGWIGTVVGTGILLFGATGVMGQLQAALNEAWDVQPDPDKSVVKQFFLKRFVSVGILLGIAFVLIVSLAMNTLLSALGDQVVKALPDGMWRAGLMAGNTVVGIVLITVMFATMYKFLPDARVPWRGVWAGAALTALLFAVGKSLLGIYLAHSDIASTYGAAGSLVLIMVWVYYSGIIFLFGAEFTHIWTMRRGHRVPPEPGACYVESTNEL